MGKVVNLVYQYATLQFACPSTSSGMVTSPWHPMARHGPHGTPMAPMAPHGPHGTPWHHMAPHGIQWHPMALHGTPWHPRLCPSQLVSPNINCSLGVHLLVCRSFRHYLAMPRLK